MRGKDSLTFVLHPRELVALRSKATEILYGAANREKRPVLCWSGWRHIEGGHRLDSEQFRSVPRTSRHLCGRLKCRETEHGHGRASTRSSGRHATLGQP